MSFEAGKPDPRFDEFEEVVNDDGQAVGFTIPNNPFVFRYDSKGGWKDEKGNKYNSNGVLMKVKEDLSDEEDDDDEEILDEFERMLDDDERGVSKKKEKNSKMVKVEEMEKMENMENMEKKEGELSYDEQLEILLKDFMEKKNLREELHQSLPLYFKMKPKFFVPIEPLIEKEQDTNKKNEKVKELKKVAEEETAKLKETNKWLLEKGAFVDYSGTSVNENIYHRYWYGVVWVQANQYMEMKNQIQQSQEFVLFEEKSFYALKSKFYLKQKMKSTISKMREEIGKEEVKMVEFTINNLPENFPASYVFELFEYVDMDIDEISRVQLIDGNQDTALVLVTQKGALKLLNLEGYCHDEKCFVFLDYKVIEKEKGNGKMFNVSTDSPYKLHYRELMDTMTLQQSKTELVKLYEEEEEKKGGYRFVIGKQKLRKVLMYRGNEINVTRIEEFKK